MAQFLASNQLLGLVLLAILAALGWWLRSSLIDLVTIASPRWRALAWVTLSLTLALILWLTFADDWRKIFGELLDIGGRFPSERAVLFPVAPAIRKVTFVLLIAALIPTAFLFARNIGGYGLAIVLAILGISAFFPLYLFRQRLDTGIAGITELPAFFSLAMLGTLFYLLLDYGANIALILTSYLGLLGIVALPIIAILDLLGQRDAPADPSADVTDFYHRLSAGIEQRRQHLGHDRTPPTP